jgi:hypothetical protein
MTAPEKPISNPEPASGRRCSSFSLCLMHVLWPAFVGAGMAVGVLFSVIDPTQIDAVHIYLNGSSEAAYTLGFVAFWVLFSLTCGTTWFMVTTERRSK